MSTTAQSVINWSFDDNSKLYFGFCLSFRSTVKRTIVSFLCFTWKFRNVTHCTQFELCTFVVQRFSFILKAIISKNRRTRTTTQRGHEVRCPLLTSHCSYLRRQRLRGRRWRLEKKKVTSLFLRLFLNQAVFFRQMIFLGFRRQKSLDDVSDEVWFENYGFEVIRTFVEPKALLCYQCSEDGSPYSNRRSPDYRRSGVFSELNNDTFWSLFFQKTNSLSKY